MKKIMMIFDDDEDEDDNEIEIPVQGNKRKVESTAQAVKKQATVGKDGKPVTAELPKTNGAQSKSNQKPENKANAPNTPSKQNQKPSTPAKQDANKANPIKQENKPNTPAKQENKPNTPVKQEKKPAAADKSTPKADNAGTPKQPSEKNATTPGKDQKKPNTPMKTLPGGLQLQEKKLGEGKPAKKGRTVSVRYIGRLDNGKVFDSNTSGTPFKFRLGAGQVIKGWDAGIEGMLIGGERVLKIPPEMAYGSKGAPPDIPPNARLTFEVKLLSVD